ncbi:hypothetical protein [Myxosarcina sp. GI1(2024)]
MALIRFNKRNICPVCGTGTKSCSHDPSTDIYLCRGTQISDEFVFVKETNNGWGTYLPKEKAEASKEASEEQKKEWIAKKRLAEQQERDRLASLLSVDERDAKLRNLLSQLTLKPAHQLELQRRGLTEAQIEAWGFKSIERYKVYEGVEGLAGFSENGKYVGAAGIICLTRNHNNKLTGFQVKADNTSKGKYVWVRYNETTAHLQNGELPITVAKTSQARIGICEGTLKPVVAANRHNITLIGLADNVADKAQVKQALDSLSLISTQPITIFPDAGWLQNANVYRTLRSTIKALTKFGYPNIEVADWGHWLSKSKCDIDEVADLDNVRYLHVDALERFWKDNQAYVKDWANPVDMLLVQKSDDLIDILTARVVKEKGFSVSRIELPAEEGDWKDYRPGELLNTDKAIEFEGTATELYEEGARNGKHYILDISQTGAGKTYAAARVEPQRCFRHDEADKENLKHHKVIYGTQQSRNPNDELLESDFIELPARNKGYKFDESKKTPMGNPYRVRTPHNEQPDTQANCHLTDKFQVVRGALSSVDVCSTCKLASQCKVAEGNGFGFKSQVKTALKATKLRANPQGLSPEMTNDKTVLIVDEYNQSVEWEQSIEIHTADIHSLIGNMTLALGKYPALAKVLPLLGALGTVVNLGAYSNNFEVSKEEQRYGMNTLQFFTHFNKVAKEMGIDLSQLDDILASVERVIEEWNHDVITGEKKASNKVLEELLTKNWFGVLFEVISGKNPYSSLNLKKNKLTLTVRNQRMLEVFNNAATVIFQDATGSRLDLALKLGVSPDEILVVRQKQDKPDNLVIHHVQGFGIAGKQRSKGLQQRIDIAREAIAALHGDAGFIDFKAFAKPGDLVHFVDGRGSNAFRGKKAVGSFGAPYPHLGTLHAQYEVYTGERVTLDNPSCQLYVNTKIAAEAIQEVGRLRANRRKDEQLHYYLCCDIDTSFLSELGYRIENMNAIELDTRAGDRVTKARLVILEAFKQLVAKGYSIAEATTSKIAEITETTKQNISKIASQFGGFDKLKRLVGALIYNDRFEYNKDLPTLDEDDLFSANQYLPGIFEADWDLLKTELDNFEEVYQETEGEVANYADILYQIPADAVAKLVTRVIEAMPIANQQRFLKLAKELQDE